MINGLRMAAVAVVLCMSGAAHAVEYSADGVAHNSTGQTKMSKIYVSNGKVRVEPVGGTSYEVLDTVHQTGYFVVPAKKLRVEQPAVMAGQNGAAYNVGVTPCTVLMLTRAMVNCKKLGADKLNGRATEKWQVIQLLGSQSFTSTVWVDRALGAIVKAQSARGTFDLQNVRMGPQSASLFVTPAGFATQQIGPPQK